MEKQDTGVMNRARLSMNYSDYGGIGFNTVFDTNYFENVHEDTNIFSNVTMTKFEKNFVPVGWPLVTLLSSVLTIYIPHNSLYIPIVL